MNLSVFRSRKPMFQMDLATAIQAVTTEQDLDVLMKLGIPNEKPVLIGLDNEPSVVKPYAEGDENQTFEALYDIALTVSDLQKMQRAGAETPDAIPPERFLVDLQVGIDYVIELSLQVVATNRGSVRKQVEELFNTDPMFRELLFEQIVTGMRCQEGEIALSVREATQTHEFHKEGERVWEFLDPSG